MKKVMIVLCLLASAAHAGRFTVTEDAPLAWSAQTDGVLEYAQLIAPDGDVPFLYWDLSDTNAQTDPVVSADYNLATGSWDWYFLDDIDYSFDAGTDTWSDLTGGVAVWEYDRDANVWTQTADGTDVWAYQDGQWIYNPDVDDEAWTYDNASGEWTDSISGSVWAFDFLDETWIEIANPDAAVISHYPALPLVQQMYMLSVEQAFLATGVLATSGPWGWVITEDGGVWTATNDGGDEAATYDGNEIDDTVTYTTFGTHALQTDAFSFSYDVASGAWSWTTSVDPLWRESWSYDADLMVWSDAPSGEFWDYDPDTKTWMSGDVSWVQESSGLAWSVFSGDDIFDWYVSDADGTWSVDDGSVVWVWNYYYHANAWVQETTHDEETITYPFPPRVVMQKNAIDSAFYALLAAGAFIDSGAYGWGDVAEASDVWSASNMYSDQTITYTKSSGLLAWNAPLSRESFTFDYADDSWTWTSGFDVDDVYVWEFDGATGEWGLVGDDAIWTYTLSTQTWSDESLWEWSRDTTPYRWKNGEDDVVWEYDPDTGMWTNTDTDNTYYYGTDGDEWIGITEAVPDDFPELFFPPLPLIQQVIICSASLHFADAGAVSSGNWYGWTVGAAGNGVWVGTDASGKISLVYDATKPIYQFTARNLTDIPAERNALVFEYDIATSNYRITRNAFGATPDIWTFDYASRRWTDAEGVSEWVWITDGGLVWLHLTSGHSWTYYGDSNTWISSESGASWSFSFATGLWSDETNNRDWFFDFTGMRWVQSSGDAVDPVMMPPLPLVGLVFSTYLFNVGAANAFYVYPIPYFQTLSEGDAGVWQNESGELTFTPAETSTNRLVFVSASGLWEWAFDPATGAFDWMVYGEEGDNSWSFVDGSWGDGETVSWSYANGRWSNSDDEDQVWSFNLVTKQWTNEATESIWVHQPSSDSWINVTNVTAWFFDEASQQWSQTGGDTVITSDLPPEPVRQMMSIATQWDSVFMGGFFAPGALADWSYTRDSSGRWYALNDAEGALVTYSAYPSDALTTLTYPVLPEWLSEGVAVAFDEGFSTTTVMNPFFPVQSFFTGSAWMSTDAQSWSFDAATKTWSLPTAGYEWSESGGVWSNEDASASWSYNRDADAWVDELGGSEWRFDTISRQWSELTDTGDNPQKPYRPIIEYVMALRLVPIMAAGNAFTMPAAVVWEPTLYNWQGADEFGNGSAVYATRSEYQLLWSDTFFLAAMRYNTQSGVWVWGHGESTEWSFDPAVGRWEDSRYGQVWLYDAEDGARAWSLAGDESQVWQSSDEEGLVWSSDGIEWTYDPVAGTWSDETTSWVYNFAIQAFVEYSDTGEIPDVFPPVPLVQQLFVENLAAQRSTFFEDNPLYAAANFSIPAHDPLYGSRPLTQRAWYGRYNAPTIMINNTLTLDHVQFVHNDLSRNLGRLQAPSVADGALPAIIGGERSALFGDLFAPSIVLQDSTVSCHESLVSAGVRWIVHERAQNDAWAHDFDAHNYAAIRCYQQGRQYESFKRRGMVFQLGSSANRMADGSLGDSVTVLPDGTLTSSSLRDAFIDVYRQAPTDGATAEDPTDIQLLFEVKTEPDVLVRDYAQHILFLAHESRVGIGWPTLTASTDYTPWSIPLTYAGAGFSPSETGGGSIVFRGSSWCVAGRLSDNTPPVRPVHSSDNGAVFYVDYGGVVSIDGSSDLTLDTTIARRLARSAAESGQVLIPSDQLITGYNGSIQAYQIDFDNAAAVSGPYEGHVAGNISSGIMELGAPSQASSVIPVKGEMRRSKKTGPVRVRR